MQKITSVFKFMFYREVKCLPLRKKEVKLYLHIKLTNTQLSPQLFILLAYSYFKLYFYLNMCFHSQ